MTINQTEINYILNANEDFLEFEKIRNATNSVHQNNLVHYLSTFDNIPIDLQLRIAIGKWEIPKIALAKNIHTDLTVLVMLSKDGPLVMREIAKNESISEDIQKIILASKDEDAIENLASNISISDYSQMIIATRGNYREIMNLSGNESITEETQFRLALHNRNFDPTYVSIMLTALYKNEKITDKTKNIITEYFENIIQSISIQEFEKIMRNNDVEWVLRLADNTRNKKTQIKLFELINVQCDSHMMETLYSQIIKRLYANKNLSETAIRLMLESEILKETLHNSIQNA
jgi:hypothetical protein